MSRTYEFPGAGVVEARAERALALPVGFVSPLWAMFSAAAGVGVAYWWMTRWTRAVNVEAVATVAPKPAKVLAAPAVVVEAVESLAEPVEAAVEIAVVESIDVVESPKAPDDLTVMTGIGPKLAAALAERGVTTFAQIAGWSADEVAELDVALRLKGRAVREAWVAQAKRLASV